jgi:hypothetical protein
LLVLAVVVAVVLPRSASAAPPEPVVINETYEAGEFCDFPVQETVRGQGKVHELPGGELLVTANGVNTYTNLDNPENRYTDRGGGSARVSQLANGDFLVKARGHNFLFLPGETILLFVGQVKFTLPGLDPGNPINILENRGRVIDICEQLA